MKFEDGTLKIGRKLSELDRKVLEFVQILDREGVKYVLVSGYVAILTGRSRGTEDIDVIIQELTPEGTEKLVDTLVEAGYWCINSTKEKIHGMLEDRIAVRFAEEDEVIPNFEVEFAQDEFETEALENRTRAEVDSNEIFISPLELQISYKLYLGSERDFEDALHLYKLFEGELDGEKLEKYCRELDVGEKLHGLREA
ncbi:MAG: hypothetical protein ABEJ72_01980 [Candidatus Aenigmatarchaeota archaeon]